MTPGRTKPSDPPLPSFLWGTATSSHQVEGQNIHNDWWAYEQAGKLKEASGRACNQWQLWEQDIDLLAKLGHNAHRFSIEWSRVEPSEGTWDEEAVQHYVHFVEKLRDRGVEPIVTLHHFTSPQWFAQKGGWENPEAANYFKRYVRRMVQALAGRVRIWITINEPVVYTYYSYLTGEWPPGHQDFGAALRVLKHMLYAHVAAYGIIHDHYVHHGVGPVWVSIAKHMSFLQPKNAQRFKDRLSVYLRNWFLNDMVFEALHHGFLYFPGMYCEMLSRRQSMDFVGVNYYTRHVIRHASWTGAGALGEQDNEHHSQDMIETNFLDWEVYPEGLLGVLGRVRKYQRPVFILENGTCTDDDEARCRFIRTHLTALQMARDSGLEVMGYLHWSLLDNFEWAEGFGPRFGIVEVDYTDFARRIRPSAQVLTESCRKLFYGG